MTLILSGAVGVSDVDGSAATPAIRGTDANTGMFFPAADTIAFAEGGVESARFTSSGGFVVGVTTDPGAGLISDVSGNVRSIPQNSQTTGYTLVVGDNGKHISITTGGVTVPSGVFAIGMNVVIFNNSGSSQTITQGGSVTLRQAGTASTGNRTLAQYGVATILCVASNTFVISGTGLT